MTPLDIPETYMKVWADYRDRVDHREHVETKVYSFPQTWGDGSCGHGGIATQAVTENQTYVFRCPSVGWFVYQGAQFSYKIENPSDEFYDDLRDWNLVGEVDYEGQYER